MKKMYMSIKDISMCMCMCMQNYKKQRTDKLTGRLALMLCA